jgi:hypothetical protein
VSLLSGPDQFVKRTFLSILEPNKDKEVDFCVHAIFYFNDIKICFSKYHLFFPIEPILNKFESVESIFEYVAFFCPKKRLKKRVFKAFGLKSIAKKNFCNLTEKEAELLVLCCKIMQLPRMILCPKLTFTEQKIIDQLSRFSTELQIIFVIPVLHTNLYYTPTTYLFSMLLYLLVTHCLPVLLVLDLLFGYAPVMMFCSASFLSLTVIVMRRFTYRPFTNKFCTAMLVGFYMYVIWSDNLFGSDRMSEILFFTKKINPIYIARCFAVAKGKQKWRYLGYAIRCYFWVTTLCIYQMSKVTG